eukprot:TRINITY_DN2939_c0_g3_i3.p1 TRINITY_DN2939_c0_g3~~TRINITY_DN2939_c0_g3_i3.p1  ORF type:complete len:103 (-),score=27.38 TRINITY_DN2939_c0_g3_i3:99-407(-)
MELVDLEKHYVLRVELPGVAKQSLSIAVDAARRITIKGAKDKPEGSEGCSVVHSEVVYGPFKKVIALPDDVLLTSSYGDAEFADGVLTIFLPKVQAVAINIK